ncbi:MAG: metallophosphoesterase family protein [Pyrinomonadaceae bacterium]
MSNQNAPVIVTYQRLSEKIGKALERPDAIIAAAKAPAPEGFEADQPPATDEEAAELMDELSNALKILEAEEKVSGVLASPDDKFTSVLQSYLAESSLQAGKVEAADGGGLEAQFDERDIIGWAKSLFTWVKKLKPHKWQIAPATADGLPDTLRVAVLGDWGTGLYGAPPCAESIQNDPKDYGLLLHLGDVYYSGTDKEITDRFLNLWPKKPNAINRACNSNHEMYTGGYAYFRQTLKQFKQSASYFALQNDHWLLVGLDSAYEEGKLANDQVAWLKGLLANSGERRVILFTHHQLFSWAEKPKAKMQPQLADLLSGKQLFAWYWGHEHRCMIYDQHPLWGIHGRCVGHSGYPYFRDEFNEGTIVAHGPQDTTWRKVDLKNMVPGGLILEGPNAYIEKHENKYGPNGYMTLEFSGKRLNEVVQAPDGSIAYERELA